MKVKIHKILIILGSIFLILLFLFLIIIGIFKGYSRSTLRQRDRQKTKVEETVQADCLKNNNGGRYIEIDGVEWWLDNTCEMRVPPHYL